MHRAILISPLYKIGEYLAAAWFVQRGCFVHTTASLRQTPATSNQLQGLKMLRLAAAMPAPLTIAAADEGMLHEM